MFHPLLSVRAGIIGGFSLLVIILMVVAAVSAWQVRRHQSDLAAMEEHATTAALIQDVHLNSEVAATAFQRYLFVGDEPQIAGDEVLVPEIRARVAAALENLTQALAQVQARGDEEQIARLKEISADAASLSVSVEQAMGLRQTGGVQAATTAYEAMVTPFRRFRDNLEEAAEAEFREASALRSQADRAGNVALWLLVISGATGAVMGLAVSVFIARSIIKPLSSLEATAAAVSRGDLSARAAATGPRELAHLGSALNSMIATVEARTEELRLANEELRESNRQLMDARAQAATDPLTGLLNHRTFHERIRDEVAHHEKSDGTIGLIMLDIDDFKYVNDSLGHQAGDVILRNLALSLAKVAKREDIYRYGGDEFAVILPCADRRKATRVAERLRRVVARMATSNGNITVSLGVAAFPEMAGSAEELIYRADMAMYWAKSMGKNRVGDWDGLLGRRTGEVVPRYIGRRGAQAYEIAVALLAGLAVKDPITSAHAERCAWYAAKLAEELGLGRQETSAVRLAALLHDVGKLVIPDAVLSKPGPLDQAEWDQMKEHPTSGLRILDGMSGIADATPAILHHHEHFDGSGYPDGLAGDDIPMASRLLLVTDAFDAMTTDRPYRKAMSVQAAIEELKRNSGSQFDPQIVEAFLKVLSRDGLHPLHSAAAAGEDYAATEASGGSRSEH